MNSESGEEVSLIAVIWKNYRVSVFFIGLSVITVGISIVLIVKSIQSTSPIGFSENSASGSAGRQYQTITVDVEGAVAYPGVYQLEEGSRLGNAILAAGDLTEDADTVYISKTLNRAQVLVDGAKIYIPGVDENMTSHNISADGSDTFTSYNIVTTENQDGVRLVSINTAGQTELESLPGVGPVTAGKIIDNRPYMTLSELTLKKVMGTALFEKLKTALSL